MRDERTIPIASRPLDALVAAPPSKSITQRALVAAALAEGRSRLRDPLLAGDSRQLIRALQTVGIRVAIQAPRRGASAAPSHGPTLVEVEGRGGAIPKRSARLHVGNAGTAMRFLTAVLATGSGTYLIDGGARMRQRPIGDLLDALRALGARAESVRGNGCPPVRVGGRGLPGGSARLAASRSSQYLSAILLAAPAALSSVRIDLEGDLVSRPYVDLTIGVMDSFGVKVETHPAGRRPRAFSVPGGQRYRARDLFIEGDYSSASYFFAAAAVTGGRVRVTGLDPASRQGDARFLDLLRLMGCRVEHGDRFVAVEGVSTLEGIDADLRSMPDVAPTLAVVALFARGPTRIRGVAHLRLKETDRLEALATEIDRLGGRAAVEADSMLITPGPLRGARIETYRDHRMAMAFAVAGLRVRGVRIRNPGCVSKSFPAFWDSFDSLISEQS